MRRADRELLETLLAVVRDEWKRRYGREPTDDEVREYLRVEAERKRQRMRAN